MTTFLVADDFAILRQGVLRTLATEPKFRAIAEASNGNEMIERALETKPDVILTDIGMPGISVFDAVPLIRQRLPLVKIAVITAHDDERYIAQAIRGKISFILKDDPMKEIQKGLYQIARGELYYSPMVRCFVEEICQTRALADDPASVLTPREREVAKLLTESNACKEIAVLLSLSLKTVETHKFNIMRKLGFHNKVDLVKFAYREGLVPCPSQDRCTLHPLNTCSAVNGTPCQASKHAFAAEDDEVLLAVRQA
jgi:two-component system response regulator NreC